MFVKFNKYFANAAVALFALILILFSGCLTAECEGYECDIAEFKLYNACYESTVQLNGYPVCTGNCESNDTKLQHLPNTFRLMLESENKAIQSAYKSAQKASDAVDKVHLICEDLFSLLRSNDYKKVSELKNDYLDSLRTFNSSYKSYYRLKIMSLLYLKSYMEKEDIPSMTDSEVYDYYKDVIELVNSYSNSNYSLDDYSSINDTDFIDNYFSDETEFTQNVFYDSSKYTNCLIDNSYNSDFCYNKENLESDTTSNSQISTYLTGFGIGSSISLAMVLGLNSGYGPVITLVNYISKSGIKTADWYYNINKSLNTLSSVEDWADVSYGREILENFALLYSPPSRVLVQKAELIQNIDDKLLEIEKELNEQENDLISRIDNLHSELKYNLSYDEFDLLYSNLQKESNLIDTLDLLRLKEDITQSKNKTIGFRYSLYKDVEPKIKHFEEINIKLKEDLKEFEYYCDDLVRTKSKNDSGFLYILDKYDSSKDVISKLSVCSNLVLKYSKNTCLSRLNSLKNITPQDYSYSTSCEYDVAQIENLFINSDEFNQIESKLNNLNVLVSSIDELYKNNSCSNSIYKTNLQMVNIENIISKVKSEGYNSYSKKLDSYQKELSDVLNSASECYAQNNYEIDYNKRIIEFKFPMISNNAFDLELNLDSVANAYSTNCVNVTKSKTNTFKFSFYCTKNLIEIPLDLDEKPNKIDIISASENSGYSLQELCFYKNESRVFGNPFYTKFVDSILIRKDAYEIPYNYVGDKIELIDIISSKACYTIEYKLSNPILIETIFASELNKYIYNVKIQNNLNYKIKNVYIAINNPTMYSKNIDAFDLESRSYLVKSVGDKFTIELKDFAANEMRNISFSYFYDVNISDINRLRDEIVFMINSIDANYMGSSDILRRLSTIINSNESAEKIISNLSKLYNDTKALISKYNLEIEQSDSYIEQESNLRKFAEQIKSKYPDEFNSLSSLLAKSRASYDLGNTKDALLILTKYKQDNSIHKKIKQDLKLENGLFDSFAKIAKTNQIPYDDYLSEYNYNSSQLESALSTSDISLSLNYLNQIVSLNNDFNTFLQNSIQKKRDDFDNQVSLIMSDINYSNLYSSYLILYRNVSTPEFDLVKKYGLFKDIDTKSVISVNDKITNLFTDINKAMQDVNKLELSKASSKIIQLESLGTDYLNIYSRISSNLQIMKVKNEELISNLDYDTNSYKIAVDYYNNNDYIKSINHILALNFDESNPNNVFLYVILIIVFVGAVLYVWFKSKGDFSRESKKYFN